MDIGEQTSFYAVSTLRTEVRPMWSFRAMADLLKPVAYKRLTCLLLRRAVGGRPCGRPSRRPWSVGVFFAKTYGKKCSPTKKTDFRRFFRSAFKVMKLRFQRVKVVTFQGVVLTSV